MAILKVAIISVTVALLGGYIVSATAASLEVQPKFQLPELRTLGTIGNKTFYTTVNATFQVNWFAARDICSQAGHQLAIFHTDDEFNFVRTQVNDYSARLWIDASLRGMSNYTERQAFVYGDGSDVMTKNVMVMPAHWLCLYFSGDDHIFSDLCLSGRQGILCQSNSMNGTNIN